MHKTRDSFSFSIYVLFTAITIVIAVLGVCIGSVSVAPSEILRVISDVFHDNVDLKDAATAVILNVRLPRVICVSIVGATLSLCGCAMQGLLQNPLADGSTMGVSSGASIGAVLALCLGISFGNFPLTASTVMAMLFSILSLIIVMTFAYSLDHSLSTYTIILMGVIFSMFASSILSLIITFAGNKVRTIMFWTMGSLAGSDYLDAMILLVSFIIFGGIILSKSRELNAFAIGEDNAKSIGVNVKATKIAIMVSCACLIGVSVSIGGTIGFVGLIIPHITRLVIGPDHRKLLPASCFLGSNFLILCDMFARIVIRPIELPIGVITSFIGSITFVYIFYSSRRKGHA